MQEISSLEDGYCFGAHEDSVLFLLLQIMKILSVCVDASEFKEVVTAMSGLRSLGKLLRPCKLV